MVSQRHSLYKWTPFSMSLCLFPPLLFFPCILLEGLFFQHCYCAHQTTWSNENMEAAPADHLQQFTGTSSKNAQDDKITFLCEWQELFTAECPSCSHLSYIFYEHFFKPGTKRKRSYDFKCIRIQSMNCVDNFNDAFIVHHITSSFALWGSHTGLLTVID